MKDEDRNKVEIKVGNITANLVELEDDKVFFAFEQGIGGWGVKIKAENRQALADAFQLLSAALVTWNKKTFP